MSDRILVPYDGSTPSEKALEYAFEKFPDADVTVLYVVPVPEGYWTAFEEPEDRIPAVDETDDRGRNILDEATEIATDLGHEITTEIATGKPGRMIVDHAEDADYDTIVLGSHGRSGASRVLLGSVAEQVIRRAPVPVTVVR